MCFKNLPVEFDENGVAHLKEGIADPYSYEVTEVTPSTHTAGTLNAGERIAISWNDTIMTEVPESLQGALLLRGDPNKRRSARLTQVFQTTEYPATATPDCVVLTWGDDPTSTTDNADLDLFVYAESDLAVAFRGVQIGFGGPETGTFAVTPGTRYYFLVATYMDATADKPYEVVLCGDARSP